jgi:NAD(P)-dependent dehydrogenase (short-subunit alcohol dehydrogenase family)
MRLAGKTALITGGNSGIGLATARAFIREGARVAITGRNQQTLDQAARDLGSKVLALRADITDVSANEQAIRAAGEIFGRLDILVASAGIGGSTPLGSTTVEQFEQIIATNLTGVFFTVQAALPFLSTNASVILLGSVHAKIGMAGWAAYSATKGAVRSMGRVMAGELSPRGIRVNVVAPGATRTPIWSRISQNADALTALEPRIAKATPSGRMSEAEEVANTILFLASDEATNIQAAEIFVDGGVTGAPSSAPIFRS